MHHRRKICNEIKFENKICSLDHRQYNLVRMYGDMVKNYYLSCFQDYHIIIILIITCVNQWSAER